MNNPLAESQELADAATLGTGILHEPWTRAVRAVPQEIRFGEVQYEIKPSFRVCPMNLVPDCEDYY